MATAVMFVQLLFLGTAIATPLHHESDPVLNTKDDSTNGMPVIVCPQDYHGVPQLDLAREAVETAQHIASTAKVQVVGFEVPATHAIFKDRNFERGISDIYNKASTWPNLKNRNAHVFCANDEAAAATISPKIWPICQETPIMFIRKPKSKIPFIALCPSFWDLGDENPEPDPLRCPDVRENVFAERPNQLDRNFWSTKAMMLMQASLRFFDQDVRHDGHLWVKTWNEVLAYEAARAWRSQSALALFALCKSSTQASSQSESSTPEYYHLLFVYIDSKNMCEALPNLAEPPWNQPRLQLVETDRVSHTNMTSLPDIVELDDE